MFFNNLRKRTSHNFSRTFEWMRSFIEHIYSAASITTTFTPKLPTLAYSFHELVDEVSLNRCHSSRIAFINSEIIWHFGLRWFTLRPIKSHTCSIGFIWGDMAGHWNVAIIAWIFLQCEPCAVWCYRQLWWACQTMDDYQNEVQRVR